MQDDENEVESNEDIGKSIIAARELAWKWFEYHAGQRLAVFRFFVIVMAFISTGYVTSFLATKYAVSALLAVIGLLITFSFYRLDRRTRVLVKIGEDYLIDDQERLAKELQNEHIKLVILTDERREYRFLCSFSEINRFIFVVIGSFGVFGLLLSAFESGVISCLWSNFMPLLTP